VARGIVAVMDDLDQKYLALVERILGYPMSEAARARILAEIEAAYRAEREMGGKGTYRISIRRLKVPKQAPT
jgi:hypothetical protein